MDDIHDLEAGARCSIMITMETAHSAHLLHDLEDGARGTHRALAVRDVRPQCCAHLLPLRSDHALRFLVCDSYLSMGTCIKVNLADATP